MDPKVVIEALFAVCSGLAAIWIRGMRDDLRGMRDEVRGIAAKVNDHGERLAVVESKIERMDRQ